MIVVIAMLKSLPRRWLSGLLLILSMPGVASADQVAILDTASEALEGRVHILESADRSIDVLYFVIHDDQVTRSTLGLLREKALLGVQVRVISNPSGFKVDPALKFHLQTLHHFEIRIFDKPVAGRFKFLRRLHDKLILVDGDHYITGGRNLGAAYFDLHENENKNKKDRDIYVIGASAVAAQDYFDDLWNSSEVSPATFKPFTVKTMAPSYCETIGATSSKRYPKCRSELEKRQRRIDAGVRQMERLLVEARAYEGYQLAVQEMSPDFRDIEDRYVTFQHDEVEAEKVQTAIELGRLHQIADRQILVQTPYLVPSRKLRELLKLTQPGGVPLEVLTNSVKSTVNLIATAATERYKKRMLDLGVIFHESTGDQMLHAKSIVYRANSSADGPPCWGVIGSFNIDPRSARLNTETLVVVRDCAFADELEESIRLYMERSVRVGSRDDLPASKALKKEISFKKRFVLATLKFLTPLYRSQI